MKIRFIVCLFLLFSRWQTEDAIPPLSLRRVVIAFTLNTSGSILGSPASIAVSRSDGVAKSAAIVEVFNELKPEFALDVTTLFPEGRGVATVIVDVWVPGMFPSKREFVLSLIAGSMSGDELVHSATLDIRAPVVRCRIVDETDVAVVGAAVGLFRDHDIGAFASPSARGPIFALSQSFSDHNGDCELLAPSPGKYRLVVAHNSSPIQISNSFPLIPVEIPVEFGSIEQTVVKTVTVSTVPSVHGVIQGALVRRRLPIISFELCDSERASCLMIGGNELLIDDNRRLFIRFGTSTVNLNGEYSIAGLLLDGEYIVKEQGCYDPCFLTDDADYSGDLTSATDDVDFLTADLREQKTVIPAHQRRLDLTLNHASLRVETNGELGSALCIVEILRKGTSIWKGPIRGSASFNVDVGTQYVLRLWQGQELSEEVVVQAVAEEESVSVTLGGH